MKTYEGNLLGAGLKFGIVVSRFNELITSKLLSGALDALKRHGVRDDDIEIAWVPGSFEIPVISKKMALTNKFDAIICLSAVIRGDTPHFEYISSELAKGVSWVALNTEIPIIFGVITSDTIEQAIERAGTKSGNKGYDAGETAIEMANLVKQLRK